MLPLRRGRSESCDELARDMATDRLHPGEAARRLRELGAPALAARLQRASKVRNGVAHPDTGLVQDVSHFLSARSNGKDCRSLGCRRTHDLWSGW